MADSLDLFTGVLLTAIGLVLVYGSVVYRLIDLILIIGVLITIFGLYKLLPAFMLRIIDSRNPRALSRGRSRSNNSLSSNGVDNASILKAGAKELTNFINGEDNKQKSVLKPRDENQTTFDDYKDEAVNFPTDYSPKEVKPIFKESTIDESKQVLRTKPVKEDKPLFKIPSIKRNSSKKSRSYDYLDGDDENQSPDKLYFTPNYEKPMKITRRPKKKSKDKINLKEAPKRSKEISQALAKVGTTETIYDNEVSDDSYSLIPKQIDEEIIMPIDEIDLDADSEPVFNLAQSENTIYNNVIYDEAVEDEDSDYYITPIHAETDLDSEEMEIPYENGDSGIESSLDDFADGGISEGYDDLEEYANQLNNLEEDFIIVDQNEDAGSLPRPTSVANTNPIIKKSDLPKPNKKTDFSRLSRPHKKIIPNPLKDESISSGESEISKPVNKADASSNALDNIVKSVMDEGSPSALNDTDSINDSNELKLPSPKAKDTESTIQIDPNNPESLPIPKLLNSYVICEKGILTSQEAFEEVASHSKEEILLEAPTIKDMGERFLSSIADIKTRVIIQEFDLEDISYVLLLSSLIKKGVEIKTQPLVNSFNLIGDTSHALLISNSIDEDNFEYGAVYNDKDSVENIKELFESSWAMANDLDIGSLIEE